MIFLIYVSLLCTFNIASSQDIDKTFCDPAKLSKIYFALWKLSSKETKNELNCVA